MPSIPSMITPSVASTVVFVALVLTLCALLVVGVARAGRALGENPAQTRKTTRRTALFVAVWLAFTGAIAASPLLQRQVLPPPLALFLVASLGVAAAAALSPLGTRLARGLPIAALVLVQAFRLPLELVLHAWYDQGVIPVQMTFEGHNFDIVSGVLALGIGLWLYQGSAPRAAIWVFNLVSSALLFRVTTIAVLSSPLPIRTYMSEPTLLLAFHFPYVWIVPFCVGGALFGHILVFRWLAHSARQRSAEDVGAKVSTTH